jgi:hypothetical protein
MSGKLCLCFTRKETHWKLQDKQECILLISETWSACFRQKGGQENVVHLNRTVLARFLGTRFEARIYISEPGLHVALHGHLKIYHSVPVVDWGLVVEEGTWDEILSSETWVMQCMAMTSSHSQLEQAVAFNLYRPAKQATACSSCERLEATGPTIVLRVANAKELQSRIWAELFIVILTLAFTRKVYSQRHLSVPSWYLIKTVFFYFQPIWKIWILTLHQHSASAIDFNQTSWYSDQLSQERHFSPSNQGSLGLCLHEMMASFSNVSSISLWLFGGPQSVRVSEESTHLLLNRGGQYILHKVMFFFCTDMM